jgi:uncharacterized DUF497 family protein
MLFEWNEAKRLTNIAKHGIDFKDCQAIFDGLTLTMEAHWANGEEQRFKTLGLLRGRLISIVHTEREGVIRLISARKATSNEQRIFSEYIPD